MDASDDEGARYSGDDDAGSVSSKGSGRAPASPKGSELGDEIQDHVVHSDHSDDDEVHVSEAEAASNDDSDSDHEQTAMDVGSDVGSPGRTEENDVQVDKEGSDAGSVSGDDGDNDVTNKDQAEKDDSDSGDEKHEPGSQDEDFAEKKEIDAGSVSGDDQNVSDKEPDDDDEEGGNNKHAENESSSPQRGDESPQEINIDSGDEDGESKLNIDSGGEEDKESENEDNAHKSSAESDAEENTARPHSPASDGGKDSDVEADTNLASDDEGSSPVKTSNMDDSKENEDTPTKEGEENNQEESDDEEVRGKSGKKKRVYGDLVSNIFGQGSSEEDNEKDEENSVPTNRKKKMRKRARVSIESDEEHEENDNEEEKEIAAESDEEMREENAEVADKDDRSDAEEKVEAENEPGEENEVKEASKIDSDDDSADEELRRSKGEDFMSDFDLMLQKKKDESSRRRRRKDVDIINDSDDLIAEIISKMRQAADEDKILNKEKKTATKKLKILPLVMSQLKKQDLKMAFLDQGVLNVMADWMAPLPDKSLPHLHIREGMIKMLLEYPSIDHSLLKSSGVGRVLMYLYKHPRETKANKEKAGKLITEWARPIFNVTTDYHSLTKEEREQRDIEHLPKKKKGRDEVEEEESTEKKGIDFNESDGKLRPGDKGWVGRARVPMPSTKDYVNRPQWNVEMELGRSVSKKPMNRFERHMRTMQEKKRNSKGQRAVTISIEGRKMAI